MTTATATAKTAKTAKKVPSPYRATLNYGKNAVTSDKAREILGWEEEPAEEDWGDDYALKDTYGKKIRLVNNPDNRQVKRGILKRYVSEFLRGKWQFNMESIVISRTDKIRDGQHRLLALILAEQQRHINAKKWGETPITMDALIGYGVKDDNAVADSYDKGHGRTLDDVLYRHETFGEGVSDVTQRRISRTLSGAIRLVWIRTGGKLVSGVSHFPHSEALEFFEQHQGIRDSAYFIVNLDQDRTLSALITTAYAAGLHYLMADVSKKKADTFWKSLASGAGLEDGSPVLALRSYLTKQDANSTSSRDAIVGAVVKAWLAYVAGEELTVKTVRLKHKQDGSGKLRPSEYPRIGGIDSDPEKPTKSEVSQKEAIILSALADGSGETSFDELNEATNIPKSSLKRILYNGDECLQDRGYVEVYTYEPQNGDESTATKYTAVITVAGKALVRA